nr:MAG TPA: hypothetical protein [Inoviridae sp.]
MRAVFRRDYRGCSWLLAPQRAARREQVVQRRRSLASPRCCSPLLAKAVFRHVRGVRF